MLTTSLQPSQPNRMPHELDAVVERADLGKGLRPLGQRVDREERARDEEERREHGADDVAEVLDRLRVAGDGDAEARPAEPGSRPMNGTASIPHEGSSPKTIATSIGTQP